MPYGSAPKKSQEKYAIVDVTLNGKPVPEERIRPPNAGEVGIRWLHIYGLCALIQSNREVISNGLQSGFRIKETGFREKATIHTQARRVGDINDTQPCGVVARIEEILDHVRVVCWSEGIVETLKGFLGTIEVLNIEHDLSLLFESEQADEIVLIVEEHMPLIG